MNGESKPPNPWYIQAEFDLPSQPGNDRVAAEQVLSFIKDVDLPQMRRENLGTAVAEATANAMEHGNHFCPDLPVHIQVLRASGRLGVRVIDQGLGGQIPQVEVPDLEAKLAGIQSPRGWGLFLIKNMVDEMNIHEDNEHHIIELVLNFHESEKTAKIS